MEYRISKIKDFIHIKVLGPLNKNAIYTVSGFLKPFLKGDLTKISLDIDDLKDEKEMVFNIGLINAFKKEIDQAGGTMILKSESNLLKKYLSRTKIDKVLNIVL